MSTILIVAEKPSSAQKIAAALGPTAKKAGYFETKYGKDTILVAPAVGHLFSLNLKEKTSAYPVFDIQWVPASDTGADYSKKYADVLRRVAKDCDSVVNACDFDIEGSLIGYNVIRFLVPKGTPAKRMQFSTLTKDELQQAFEKASELDTNNALAGEARHMLDWYYGINLSRALMHALKAAGTFKVMSIGRVQGPTLSILAKRENEIASFKPTPFWELFALVKDIEFSHVAGKFEDKQKADTAFKATDKKGTIESIKQEKRKVQPPFPYDLTSLQVDAYRCFGFAPNRTLQLAQSLYEAAVISYPRTASQQLSEKLNLKGIIQMLAKQAPYAKLAGQLISASKFTPHNGPKSDPAHPAIHPTGQVPSFRNPQEQKLYDLIVKRYLACFADPAKRESMTVIAKLGNEQYKTTGSRTLEPGWLEYFGEYVGVKETEIPPFKEGEQVTASKIDMVEKMTQPPKRYSPSSIIKRMEEIEIGTKATRAEVLETLYSRGYVDNRKSIEVTPFGMSVYKALSTYSPLIMSEDLTRDIESQMEKIEEGKVKQAEVVSKGRKVLEEIIAQFKATEVPIGKSMLEGLNIAVSAARELGPCKCGAGKLVIRRSKFGQFVGCSAYPNCRNLYPLPHQAFIEHTDKICEKCNTPIIIVKRKGKRTFNMCIDPKCVTKESWAKKPPAPQNGTSASTSSTSAASAASSGSSPAAKPKRTRAKKAKS